MPDPQQGQTPYLSTDPSAGVATAPPPATAAPATAAPRRYLSTDPAAGQGGGRGGGPGRGAPPSGGRGGAPGGPLAASPPPSQPFYPGGWKGAAQDLGGVLGGTAAAVGATALLPEEAVAVGSGLAAREGMQILPKALPFAARVARGALTIAGAGAGGGAAAAATGAPLSVTNGTGEEDSVAHAFKNQAEMEATGLGTGWVLGAIGRRAIASRVANQAKDWLEATRKAHLEDVQGILERAQDAIRAHATAGAAERAARTEALVPLEDAAQHAKLTATGATSAAKAVRESGKAQVAQIATQWPQSEAAVAPPMRPLPQAVQDVAATLGGGGTATAVSAPPAPTNYPALAAQHVAEVVSGPAQRSLNQLGQAVEESAKTGPRLNLAPVKAKAQSMVAGSEPAVLQQGQVPEDVAGYFSNQSPEEIRAILAKAGVALEPSHPLPGVLSTLSDMPDTVSFEDAHRLKRSLDDAIGWKPAGAVQAPAKTQLKQITKGVRGQIRQTMAEAGHQPYEQASAAYADASRLFGPQGLARKIQATAETNPEALVNSLVKVNEPTKLKMLHEVLTEHAAQGGGEAGAAAGQDAWQRVQSTVMYKHLIQPGLDNFDASVAKMHPEFLHELTSDPAARGVFDRLQQMSEAVKAVQARTAEQAGHFTKQAVAARGSQAAAEAQASVLRQQGKAAEAQRAVEGQQLQTERLRAARGVQEARKPTPQEEAFDRSTLGKQPNLSTVGSDAAYAVMAPPGSPRQVAGAARLVLKGPKVNDLIRWASLSPTGTQAFVRAVTSPEPGAAIAALVRLQDWMGGEKPPEMAVGHTAATPPPGPKR